MAFPVTAVLKPLVGPVAGWLGSRKSIRRLRATIARGRGAFGIPRGKIYLLVPEHPDGRGGFVVSTQDDEACTAIEEMLSALSYRKGRDWHLWRVRNGDPLPEEVRRENLITLCGPAANPVAAEMLEKHGSFWNVTYAGSPHRSARRFRWKHRVYRTAKTHDFAYVGIHANPENPDRRLMMLFGLRAIGTLGAALLFAKQEYRKDRRAIVKQAGTVGAVEVLLFVDETADQRVSTVRIARDSDSMPAEAGYSPERNTDALCAIAGAVDEYLKRIAVSALEYKFTVLEDFSVKAEDAATFTAADNDLLIFTKLYSSDIPLEELAFSVNAGSGDVVFFPIEAQRGATNFLLFPIPPVRVGESRRFQFSATHPRNLRSLEVLKGQDYLEVEVSPKAAAPVDFVSIEVLFESKGGYVVECIDPKEPPTSGSLRQACMVNSPYRITFAHVRAGATYVLRIVRVS